MPLGRQRQRRVPGRDGLIPGQRAIGRPEHQAVRQRSASGAHLSAGEDIEQPDRLKQRPSPLRERRFYVSGSGNVLIRNTARENPGGSWNVAPGNDEGPVGSAATATSPWANIIAP